MAWIPFSTSKNRSGASLGRSSSTPKTAASSSPPSGSPARAGQTPRPPCLIISPDELNHHLRTAIVTPMTTGGHAYPFRPACRFGGKEGRVTLDQIRTVDRDRLRKRLGVLPPATRRGIFGVVAELFEFS